MRPRIELFRRSWLGANVALIALSAAPGAQAQVEARSDSGPVVVTFGAGTVSLPPDRAEIFFAVQTRGRSAAAASQQNAAAVRRVLDTLKSVVSTGDSVEVPAVHVSPIQNPESSQITGYEAIATVRVALKSLDRLPRLLDAGLNAGVTSVESVDFQSDRVEAGRSEALARAYRQARASAEALARAAGMVLGSLVRMSTEQDRFAAIGMMEMRVSQADTPITPQNVKVHASVQVTWRLTR